jgi:hypothetical protein
MVEYDVAPCAGPVFDTPSNQNQARNGPDSVSGIASRGDDSCSGIRHPRIGGEGAGQQVLFHIVLGTFHINLLLSREFRVDSVKHRGTSRKVLG